MVSAEGVVKNNFETLRHFSFNRAEKPIGVQILGNDHSMLCEAVKEISKMNPDLIDLNCGCPVDKVTSNAMGSALLDDPKVLGKLVRNMVDGSNGIPVSVKLRLGKNKSNINILENVRIVEENGASIIFIHARTRADQYNMDADWTWLNKVKEVIQIPIVGNGSLFTPHQIKNMLDITSCNSAMIARGALGNPFIFSRFNKLAETGNDPGEPSAYFIRDTILRHIKYLEEEYGVMLALDKAKKHSIWYFKNYTGINSLLDKIFSIKNLEALRELVINHAENMANNPAEVHNQEEIHKKFQKKVLFWLANEDVNAYG